MRHAPAILEPGSRDVLGARLHRAGRARRAVVVCTERCKKKQNQVLFDVSGLVKKGHVGVGPFFISISFPSRPTPINTRLTFFFRGDGLGRGDFYGVPPRGCPTKCPNFRHV